MHVVFVCYGNVCRSPMAEYIFRDMIARDPVLSRDNIRISSAGILPNNGVAASDQALLVMLDRGLNQITRHKGKAVNEQLLSEADLILTMENTHTTELLALYPQAADRTFLLSEYAGYSGDIADPTGKSTQVFSETADTIRKYLTAIAAKWREKLSR